VKIGNGVAVKKLRVLVNNAPDLTPQELLQVTLRRCCGCVDLRIGESLVPPDSYPSRTMRLPRSIGAFGYCYRVIPD